MNDTEYLNSLLQQEKSMGINTPSMIPVPSIYPSQNQQTFEEHRPNLSREPSAEEKIQMMGAILGTTMQQASKADSDYVDLGNPQGFRERAAARQNLYKIAENLDKQRDAIRRGQQTNLNPINTPVINEPVIPNFINTQQISQINQQLSSNKKEIPYNDPNQLEFDFKQTSNDDILNEIIKLNNKINNLYDELINIKMLLNTSKKKLK